MHNVNVFIYFTVIKAGFEQKTNVREDFRKHLQGNFRTILPQALRIKKAEKSRRLLVSSPSSLAKGCKK